MITEINEFIEKMNSSTSSNDKVEIIRLAEKNVLRVYIIHIILLCNII